MDKLEQVTGEPEILEKLNKTLDELLLYKNVYVATIESTNDRMSKIEKKLGEVKPEFPKEFQVQIEKVEQAIENISKSQKEMKKNLNELLEGHEKVLSQLEKERKDDLAYMKGLDNEVRSLVISTNDKLQDMEKEIAKTKTESEKANRLKAAFQNLFKAIME
jgi:chromosome segregation ATPase